MPPKETPATITNSAGQGNKGKTPGIPATSKIPTARKPGQASNLNPSPKPSPPGRTGDRSHPSIAARRTPSPSGSNTEPWHLSNFSFYLCGPGKSEVAYGVNIDEFRLIADAYHIGNLMFNRNDTKSALISLGESCADTWTSALNRKKYVNYSWQGERSKIGTYLEVFKRGISHISPTIYNDPEIPPQVFGVTEREIDYKMNWSKLNTRELFRISINTQLVRNIKDAFAKHEDDRYQELRMLIAVTFFHELVHGFVNFLIGDIGEASVRTPPDCCAIWEDVATVMNGESGYFVEGEVYGGALMITPFPSGSNKRGRLYVRCENDILYEVTTDTVKGFLKGPRSYNLKNAIIEARVITQVQRPAKRQKTSHDINLRPRTRQDAWNIRFHYNMDHTPISLIKEKMVIIPIA